MTDVDIGRIFTSNLQQMDNLTILEKRQQSAKEQFALAILRMNIYDLLVNDQKVSQDRAFELVFEASLEEIKQIESEEKVALRRLGVERFLNCIAQYEQNIKLALI